MAPEARVTRFQGDLQSSDHATAETVALMCRYIRSTAQDPMVKAAARDALRRFRGGPLYQAAGIDPQKSAAAQCESVWWWAKHVLKFVHHDGLIQLWFNERDQLQLLISPDLLLRMGEPRGDCAIYTMLECAMLESLGIGYEIVTAAVDPHVPDEFSHVYPRAVLPTGKRIVLDASHGKYPGWEVPKEHTIRKQVWGPDGQPIADEAPARSGLHGYAARPNRPKLPRMLALVPGVPFSNERQRQGLGRYRRGMGHFRGLGQDDGTNTVQLDPTLDTSNIPIGNIGPYPTAVPSTPSAPSPWASIIGNLANQWTTIGGRVIAPTTTIQGPGGTLITTPSSSLSQLGGATSLLPASLSSGGLLPILLLGGGLLLIVMMANKK